MRKLSAGRRKPSDVPISVQGIGVRCIPQLVAPIDARVGGLHPRDERSRHLDSGRSRPPTRVIRGLGRAYLSIYLCLKEFDANVSPPERNRDDGNAAGSICGVLGLQAHTGPSNEK
eukprot:scaffold71229_cov34-Phaeocystis_antarctica.AAC.1